MNPSSKSFSKTEAESYIKKAFSDPDTLTPEKLKKLKHLAMSKRVKIGVLQKSFCKKCYSLFNSKNCETRVKMPFKTITCRNCSHVTRYKISKC